MSNKLDINLQHLNEIHKGLTTGDLPNALDEISDSLVKIDDILEEFSGDAIDALKDVIQDAMDSRRGIKNNLEDFTSSIKDYYDDRSDGIALVSESRNIMINSEIKTANQDIRDITSDIKSTLRKYVNHVSLGIGVLDADKRYIVKDVNERINQVDDAEKNYISQIEFFLDEAKELVSTMEKWYESDYNEVLNFVGTVVEVAAVSAFTAGVIAVTGPVGGMAIIAVASGAKSTVSTYRNGMSTKQAIALGAASGALTYVGGKKATKGLKASGKRKELIAKKMKKISLNSRKYADEYVEKARTRLVKLGLHGEELAIRNSNNLGMNNMDEIMHSTDRFISGLSDIKSDVTDFVAPKLRSTTSFLSEVSRSASDIDNITLAGLNDGDYLITLAYNAKEEVKNQTKEYMEENHPDAMESLEILKNEINDFIDKQVQSLKGELA